MRSTCGKYNGTRGLMGWPPALLFVMETIIKGKRVEKLTSTLALLEDLQ
jgi:hypothetical protein